MIKSLEGSAAGYLMEHYPEELAMNLALAAVVMPGMSGRELADPGAGGP